MANVILSDVIDIISGGTPKTSESKYWSGGNIDWLSINDFNNGNRFVYSSEKKITELALKESNIKLLNKGDVIISARGTVGVLAQIGKPMCFNQSCFGLRGKKELIDNDFLYYVLKNYIHNLKKKSQGSVFDTINIKSFDLMEIDIPNYASQCDIASVLSVLDQKIELNNHINAELEAMAKTLYDYWFVQFDFPNEEGEPYKSSGGKMVYNSILKREIPEGWSVDRLQSYINFKRGISYKSNEISDIQGKEFLNLNSFSLKGEFKIEGTKYFIGKYNQESLVSSGGLVVAITDVTRNADIIGKAFIIPNIFEDGALISCDVVSVTSERLNKFYLEQLFNSTYYHRYIKYYASGTLVLHLNLNGINWFNTILPPVGLLNQFEKFCKPILKKKAVILKENKQLIELRDWLLPMLMNGQVTVK